MKKWRMGLSVLLGVMMFLATSTGFAQRSAAQKKLAAQRAARADAMRKLVEQLKGMEIMAGTKVVDFAVLEDVIRGRTEDVVRGCREKGPPKYYEDGTCEVTLEVTIAEITENLKYVLKGKYKGDKFKGEEFEQLTIKTDKKIIEATGTGSDVDLSVSEPTAATGGGVESGVRELSLPGVWKKVPGRERLKAIRAAEMDGKRKLVERIFGTEIKSDTTVRDFALESDEIAAKCRAFIQGARVEGPPRYLPDGIVEVRVVMPVEEVIVNLKRILEGYYKGDKFKGEDFERIKITVQSKEFEEIGRGAIGITPEEPSTKEIKVDVDVEKKEAVPAGGQKKEGGVVIEKKTVVE